MISAEETLQVLDKTLTYMKIQPEFPENIIKFIEDYSSSNSAFNDSTLLKFILDLNELDENGETLEIVFYALANTDIANRTWGTLIAIDAFSKTSTVRNLSVNNKICFFNIIVMKRLDYIDLDNHNLHLMIDIGRYLCPPEDIQDILMNLTKDQIDNIWFPWTNMDSNLEILPPIAQSQAQIWLKNNRGHEFPILFQKISDFLTINHLPSTQASTTQQLKSHILTLYAKKACRVSVMYTYLTVIAAHELELIQYCAATHCPENYFPTTENLIDQAITTDVIALVDVDGTLLSTKNKSIYNLNLIRALISCNINHIYLFSDMVCTKDAIDERETLIRVLEEHRITVLGVLTPADLFYDYSPEKIKDLDTGSEQVELIELIRSEALSLFNRLSINRFPPTTGQFYDLMRAEFQAVSAQNNPDTVENELKILDDNAIRYIKVIREFAYKFFDYNENFLHVKTFLFHQFTQHHPKYRRIIVIDDQESVLKGIENTVSSVSYRLTTIKIKPNNNFTKSVTEYALKLQTSDYLKYQGAHQRFFNKFERQLATIQEPQTSPKMKIFISLEEVKKNLLKHLNLVLTNNFDHNNLFLMIEFALAHYQEQLEESISYLFSKYPDIQNAYTEHNYTRT